MKSIPLHVILDLGGSGKMPKCAQLTLLDSLLFDSSIKNMNFIVASTNAHVMTIYFDISERTFEKLY